MQLHLKAALLLAIASGCRDDAAATPTGSSSGGVDSSAGTGTSSEASTGVTTQGDSSSSAATSSSSSSSDTGFVPAVCGDGVVEGDEECEDGNREPDDGCDLQCNRSGTLLWSITWDGPAGTNDGALGLAVADDGRFVVVGHEGVVGNGSDVFVSMREANGDELWHAGYDASGESDDASRVAIAPDGGAVVIGYSTASSVQQLWLRRYDDDDGGVAWTYEDAGQDGIGAAGIDVAFADDGTLYAVTTSNRMDATDAALVLVLDAQLGTVLDTWVFADDEVHTRARGIAAADDLFVLLGETSPTEANNAVLRRLSPDGTELWSVTERGDGGYTDELGRALQLDGDGTVVVAGNVEREDQDAEAWTARYDGDGAQLWSRTFHRSPAAEDRARDVALDSAGEVYVTGSVSVIGQQLDLFARRYSADGIDELWTSTWDDASTNLTDVGEAVVVLDDGVLVAGTTSIAGNGEDVILRKYAR